MAKERILIVEDEQIVAEDLKRMLERLGYDVVGKAASGEEALGLVERFRPQMVLMDVRLQGPMDGIEVAERIFTHFDIPVSYLTAYADRATLERAKATMPFGYILKPFEERHLQTTIDLALFRHKMDRMFKSLDRWQTVALQNLSEAVLTLDSQNRVTFLNRAAERLLDRNLDSLLGQPLDRAFRFQDGPASPCLFVDANGRSRRIDCASSPMEDENGDAIGSVLVLKEPSPPVGR